MCQARKDLLELFKTSGSWSILGGMDHIAGEKDGEAQLRYILGPLDEIESKPDPKPMLDQRKQLDEALRKLTLIELGYQLGILSEQNDRLAKGVTDSLLRLFESEAFLRYVTANLFFGIRFLAERLNRIGKLHPYRPIGEASDRKAKDPGAAWNVRPFALMTPPTQMEAEPSGSWVHRFDAPADGSNIKVGLAFLDGSTKVADPVELELWLRGLQPGIFGTLFEQISEGLVEWALSRSEFYLELSKPVPTSRPVGGWIVTHPVCARLALADIYWLGCLLRADVTATATVTYPKRDSWLGLLRIRAALKGDATTESNIAKAEEVLRSVFDFVCDLIQNAVDLTTERERLAVDLDLYGKAPKRTKRLYGSTPETTKKWRQVFDEELDTIELERKLRRFLPSEKSVIQPWNSADVDERGGSLGAKFKGYWNTRITEGSQPLNLIGLAFSGGGIRSATFNLGILQGLQEFDQLRQVDYISSVSGGGFIASWLVANVRRSAHWLARLTDWSESIAHLRAYSNYLAPRTGILSADTWNLATSWARNAILIQLTGLAWLFFLLSTALGAERVFDKSFSWNVTRFGGVIPDATIVSVILGLWLTGTVLYNLGGTGVATARKTGLSSWVQRLVIIPAWIGSTAIASRFWAEAAKKSELWKSLLCADSYSEILKGAWRSWQVLLICSLIAFFVIAWFTLQSKDISILKRLTLKLLALVISPACVFILYLELCSIFFLFRSYPKELPEYSAMAFVFGPSMVLVSFSLSVLLLIGLTGRYSNEAIREWWTRLGTWLGIYGVSGLALYAAATFGPELLYKFFTTHGGPLFQTIKWTSVASWLGTVVSGLLAGKSSKTTGTGASKSPALEIVARVGGFVFIVGSILIGSSLLYFLLLQIFTNQDLSHSDPVWVLLISVPDFGIVSAIGGSLAIALFFSWFFEINIFGLSQFYRNRIVRCYLGASRWTPGMRVPNPFTQFDFNDDLQLHQFKEDIELDKNGQFRGPFPIINCSLNLGGSSDLAVNTRHSASFFLTPLRCGADRPRVGYAPTKAGDKTYVDGIMLGQAVAVSGAAVSSNMGYNTSPLAAFLLTMFNVRLGWWFPNPGKTSWYKRGLRFSHQYLVAELFGYANENRRFLNVSDGGHFENLGIYELVRRRCKVIIACDAECDEFLQFGSLGNVIRICETDFGAIIDLDVKSIRSQQDGYSLAHCAVGTIKYSNGSIGYLVYFKASMTGDEPVSVAQYKAAHPSFPHETTADQFFSEDQFESYRLLGRHVIEHSLRGISPGKHPVGVAEKLIEILTAAGCSSEVFLKHTRALDKIWERFRCDDETHPFLRELMKGAPRAPGLLKDEEVCLGLELIQLMENVFLDLRLDDFWEHPDNRGWVELFTRWSRSLRFREVWIQMRPTYGIRFEHFCAARLGLPQS